MNNRDIKFRAWNVAIKKMIDLKKITPLALNMDTDGLFLPFSDGLPLMQFTGLKDKNGIEIYERDIVSMISYNYQHMNNYRWKVIYHPESMSFKFYYNDGKRECYEDTVGWHSFEVIGNVYENSDLLNSEQNPEPSVATGDASKENAGPQTGNQKT